MKYSARQHFSRLSTAVIWSIGGLLVVGLTAGSLFGQPQSPRVRVKLAVTSGLPNPGWFFEESDLPNLRAFLKGLPEIPAFEEPSFDSFILEADEARCRFPGRVVVFEGQIKVVTADGQERFFSDEKGFEEFLREEARDRGLGEFLREP